MVDCNQVQSQRVRLQLWRVWHGRAESERVDHVTQSQRDTTRRGAGPSEPAALAKLSSRLGRRARVARSGGRRASQEDRQEGLECNGQDGPEP